MKLIQKIKRRTRNPPLKTVFENRVWRTLKYMLRKHRGAKCAYETEKLPYTLHKRYIPDFVIEKPNGKKIYIEAKGYFRPADRTKILAVVRDNNIDLRLLFQQDNFLRKGSKTRYSDWARKHGIPFSVGEIPSNWLK